LAAGGLFAPDPLESGAGYPLSVVAFHLFARLP
jgi:hypothetical protein